MTGITTLLIFNESLYYGTNLYHSLINPNQVWHYNIGYWYNPYDTLRGLHIELDNRTSISLDMKGTKVKFTSRSPTSLELDLLTEQRMPTVVMTSLKEWNPSKVQLSEVDTDKSKH